MIEMLKFEITNPAIAISQDSTYVELQIKPFDHETIYVFRNGTIFHLRRMTNNSQKTL